jgi:hypothetical protein
MTYLDLIRKALESKVHIINPRIRKCKLRLYVGYFLRPSNPMHPHQALLVGREYTSSKRAFRRDSSYLKFHIFITTQATKDGKSILPSWTYESTTIIDIHAEERLVALVCLGKVRIPLNEVKALLAEVPIYQPRDPNPIEEKAKRFKDTTWVASAFNMLNNRGFVSHAATLASTDELETKSHAFTQAYGRWGSASRDDQGIPVLDLSSVETGGYQKQIHASRVF